MAATSSLMPDPTTLPVADLLAGIGANDPQAWAEIIRRYRPLVVSRARRYHLQEADLLDAVQTTWLRLAEHWHSIESPERLAGWLSTTVCREALRLISTGRRLVCVDAVDERLLDAQPGPEQRVVDAETVTIVRDLVDGLPARRRDLLDALFGPDPQPYAELSRHIGIPIGSIGPTRARALSRLRPMAEAIGLDPRA
jgi:RNA polymerase sigma factor (sigma-70 family)